MSSVSSELLYKDARKHIVIIGAGAAGMSCAATLAQHPDKFRVTMIERESVCGGQATSIPIDEEKHGASWLNNGVQGGSPIFRHTFNFFQKYGHEPQRVKLQVSFGKGKDSFWTNVFPSQLVEQYSADIKKFGRVLKIIKYTMPVLGLVPIKTMLRMFFFSKDFGDKMVFPLIALFLGTGNQTANVSCAILERLFHDPNMKLWDYDPDTLLPNLPTMMTFPKLSQFYSDWCDDLRSKGVDVRLNTAVTKIVSRSKKGVVLETAPYTNSHHHSHSSSSQRPAPPSSSPTTTETFDEMVLAILADDAKRLLGKTASWRERFVLGGAKFYDDVTVTHSDASYFRSIYETQFDPALCARPHNAVQEDQIAFASGSKKAKDNDATDEPRGFKPMYFTHSYAEDPQKIEMSFDCTNYQHQFRQSSVPAVSHASFSQPPSHAQLDAITPVNPDQIPSQPLPESETAFDYHVFQSIFLDKSNSDMWTMNQIDSSKIIEKKWWHQLGHRWQHYVRVVPGMMWIQGTGRRRTWFAGSWTLVNMHELAIVSGIAAAYRIGAEYRPFDDFATDFFQKYLLATHGVFYRKGGKGKGKGKDKDR